MSLVAMPVFADENAAILPENLEEDIPVEFIPTLDTTISVGLRRLNNGPKVRFGNLGSMTPVSAADSESYRNSGSSFVSHFYTDGYVLADTLGTYEQNADGDALGNGETYSNTSWVSVRQNNIVTVYQAIQTATSNVADGNGLYLPNTTTVINPDGSISQTNTLTWASVSRFKAHDGNYARTWSALNKSQIQVRGGNTYVDMHSDGVMSAGASLEADSSASSGFDISIERRLGKRGKLDWGVSAGVKFNYVNAKATGVFPAFLVRTTDSYLLEGNGTNINTTQPTGGATNLYYTGLDGTTQLYRYVDSTTAPGEYVEGGDTSGSTRINLSDGSTIWGTPEIAGIVMIHGNYQLKGAYLLAHVGPTFRYNFTDRWAVSGTFGLALGWTGTNFKATEYYNTWNDLPPSLRPDLEGNTTEYHWSESVATHKFSPGLYFDLNAEYWVTDRTAFFTGVTGQTLRQYNSSKLSGRTATVEATKNSGWTIGIRTRF